MTRAHAIVTPTMREALSDPHLLGRVLEGDSWQAWRVMLIAMMGEPLINDERVVFARLTNRQSEPLSRSDFRHHWQARREEPCGGHASRLSGMPLRLCRRFVGRRAAFCFDAGAKCGSSPHCAVVCDWDYSLGSLLSALVRAEFDRDGYADERRCS